MGFRNWCFIRHPKQALHCLHFIGYRYECSHNNIIHRHRRGISIQKQDFDIWTKLFAVCISSVLGRNVAIHISFIDIEIYDRCQNLLSIVLAVCMFPSQQTKTDDLFLRPPTIHQQSSNRSVTCLRTPTGNWFTVMHKEYIQHRLL
jgi:hypothetical protein